ncbi:hypothetical protein A1351_16340 [Methylosinus sp. R-45379]|nr:hypothetical protein A1351_16340 [Methylosinus sp. R-45379]
MTDRVIIDKASSGSAVLPDDETDGAYLQRRRQRESNARTDPCRLPIVGRSRHVPCVEDTNALDRVACAGARALGHKHPVVAADNGDALDVDCVRTALSAALPDCMVPRVYRTATLRELARAIDAAASFRTLAVTAPVDEEL